MTPSSGIRSSRSEQLTDDVAAQIVNVGFAIGVGHFALGAPWWASVMWLSLESSIYGVRRRVKHGG